VTHTFKDRFDLPEGVIYLDGNSLGAMPRGVAAHIDQVIRNEWGRSLIRAWNAHDWVNVQQRVGAKIAGLVGAHPDEVLSADSTSINLYKTLAAALALRPGRTVILSTPDNFPTDLYIAGGLIAHLDRGHTLKLVPADEIEAHLDDTVAVLTLTQVNYRTGELYDMARLTERAQAAGALTVWDLSHTAGAMPVVLNASRADFAVGCGYKYLNGGPGAPAFLFVARRWQDQFSQPLSGWLGHAQPFAFTPDYVPADGVSRYVVGTPPVLSSLALEFGIDLMLEADLQALRHQSLALTDAFIDGVHRKCAGHGLKLLTPMAHDRRGSQVSFAHPDGYAMIQALIAAGVIGDFRAPDILRFGFTPLYIDLDDVAVAVDRFALILREGTWRAPQFQVRKKVT
jgi:kynureninase